MAHARSLSPYVLTLVATFGSLSAARNVDAAEKASASASKDGNAKASFSDKWKAFRAQEKKEAAKEREKAWIKRWAPENNELDLGVYMGAFVLAENHSLFNTSLGDQPEIRRAAFNMGFRATYFPIRFVGVGIEGGFAPTRSPALAAPATVGSFRGHLVGQLPLRVTPLLVIGGGFLNITSPEPRMRDIGGAFHWGLGVKFHVTKWIAVRLDGRHIVADGNDGNAAHHGEINVGLDVTLRLKSLLGLDRDGDGVPDRRDECPDTAGDGDDGCPTDRDKDGIVNDRDKCPDEWGDQANGCPSRDRDGDGIGDAKDKCIREPETVNQFEDADGCPDRRPKEIEEFSGVIKGIQFDFGKATIRESSFELLDRAVEVLKKYPELRLEISGHSDSVGSRKTNLNLSQKRADAVKTYLVKNGVDEGRLETRGVGPDEPVADNGTEAGRAENRRIEFKLLD